MIKLKILPLLFLMIPFILFSQQPNDSSSKKTPQNKTVNKNSPRNAGGGFGGFGGGGAQMNIGSFYGKVVDAKGKGIEFVSVQLLSNVFDTVKKRNIQKVIQAFLTEKNGDFIFENLNVLSRYRIKISSAGYKTYENAISLDFKAPTGGNVDFNQILNNSSKDLGNIKLDTSTETLKEVVVTSTKPIFEVGVDRKIFNVDKNLTSVGQTATEVLKTIPSIQVDVDGNVTLRNETPTIFVDGRPTNLTIDQIPADAIERVEIISNPSAKFDAASGAAGIVNIVLKKNQRKGYNGNIQYTLDSRLKSSTGGLFNFRTQKFNFSIIGNIFTRSPFGYNEFDRSNNDISTPNNIHSLTNYVNNSAFGFGRTGFDFYIDNRNTISIYAVYVKGQFKTDNNQRIDSSLNNNSTGYNLTTNSSLGQFSNLGTQLSYKHSFKKKGQELTADFNYNSSTNFNNSDNRNTFLTENNLTKSPPYNQKTDGEGNNSSVVGQLDFETPFGSDWKLETGLRYNNRTVKNYNNQFIDPGGEGDYILLSGISLNYKYFEEVYAAYGNVTYKYKNWNFQVGLRLQNRNYYGNLLDKQGSDSAGFNVNLPFQLFPSSFVTYKINATQDIQFNYSRKLSPPNFFQLFPFPNYSDPQNVTIGNPGLNPQFNNILELVYNNAYKRGANFFASIYFRNSEDIITNYVYLDKSAYTGDSVLFSSYINANYSQTIGLELSNKISLFTWWDWAISANLFNSNIVSNVANESVNNNLIGWNAKTNNTFKLPKNFTIQLSADYTSKTILPPSSSQGTGGGGFGGRGGGGGGGFGGGIQSFANGYILPRFVVDAAIKKDFNFKNKNSLSITLSVSDLLKTQIYSSFVSSSLFSQTTNRTVLQQYFRLTIRYQFGKFDLSTIKRKSNKGEQGGDSEIIQQ
ncbi:MAG: outer membrane beta-barrel family protein [Alphaproteobacteria bacterium]|nr:outer membrane beta-barrel family protein [Alphaproteobacteria bacterium]